MTPAFGHSSTLCSETIAQHGASSSPIARPAFADLPSPAEAGFAKAGAKPLRLRAGRSPGFAQAGGDLDDALRRNLYGGVAADQGQLAAMAAYLRREAGAIAAQDGAARLAGAIAFGAPPVVAEAVP